MAKVGAYSAAACAAAATVNILSGGKIGWAAGEIGVAVLASLTAIRLTILQAAREIVDRSPVRREESASEFKPGGHRL